MLQTNAISVYGFKVRSGEVSQMVNKVNANDRTHYGLLGVFICFVSKLKHLIMIIVQTYLKALNNLNVVRYMLPSLCLRFNQFSIIFYSIHGVMCLQLTRVSAMFVRMCTLFYYHRQIGSMNHYQLDKVWSQNNGMRCMFYSSIKKNIERYTAHTIVSWLNPKQWVIVHTSDLMMIIRQSIYILSIITKEMGKLKTHRPTYCIMDNWENMDNLTDTLDELYPTSIL